MRGLTTALLLFSLACVAAGEGPSPRPFFRAGYLPDWSLAKFNPEQLGALTDLIVFSADPEPEGDVKLSRFKPGQLKALRTLTRERKVRLIFAIGGWERSKSFAEISADETKRRRFAETLARLCNEHGFDGIDLDWEHPRSATEQADFAKLLAEIRRVFETRLLLFITVACGQKLPPEAYASVDRVQLMAYDDQGRHATFEYARRGVEKLLAQRVPAEKIVLGIPFYGRKVDQFSDARSYAEIVRRAHPLRDADEADGFYFNGPALVERKVKWALAQKLAGVMVWELGQDAPGTDALLPLIARASSSSK